jgi:hypothetical protein
MRVILILVLSVFMGSAAAITRCELNGKVYYQTARCPKQSKAQYLVNDKNIDEDKLRKYRRINVEEISQETPVVGEEETKQVTNSKASADAETQESAEQENNMQEQQPVKDAPHVNVPRAFDYVNPKLSDMQRKLDAHNKELQNQQNAQ